MQNIIEKRDALRRAQYAYNNGDESGCYEAYKLIAKTGLLTLGYLGVRAITSSMIGERINPLQDNPDTLIERCDAMAAITTIIMGGFGGLSALITRMGCKKEIKELRSAKKELQEALDSLG
ncbi:hypothetical protein HYT56_04475 [Candidatus Woesearchaeota archaeon]|nr:hypothetical protein [Candidatus Woesearchaeota archaeon]